MKPKPLFSKKLLAATVCVLLVGLLLWRFATPALDVFAGVAVKSVGLLLPGAALQAETAPDASAETKAQPFEAASVQTETVEPETEKPTAAAAGTDFTKTPADIKKLMAAAKKASRNDRKDGAISLWQYTSEGATDELGAVKVKNVNKTQIDLEKLLAKKPDLSVGEGGPAVLIFHTHTTETYQLVDRDYYPTNNVTRSTDSARNMVRIGDAICEQLDAAGIEYIHDTKIHDERYTGAYDNSRETAVEYLKKYPSIQVVLDVHRDAIERTDGTKIRPVATIGGKKAAQIMIISGCQEEGNGLTEFPDWRENLVFALALQRVAEESFPGLMRPLYFCPRMYNMNLTHCSLLLEIGSDSNTLEEAEYAAQCIGNALAKLILENKEEK